MIVKKTFDQMIHEATDDREYDHTGYKVEDEPEKDCIVENEVEPRIEEKP